MLHDMAMKDYGLRVEHWNSQIEYAIKGSKVSAMSNIQLEQQRP